MADKVMDPSQLDQILKSTIDSLEKGKEQIFEIAEDSRNEWERLENNLKCVQEKVVRTIGETEKLEFLEQESRKHLMVVSKNFDQYSENDIKDAYETTRDLQVQLALKREQEQQYIQQRTEIELQIRRIKNTMERAEYLVGHVAAAMNYLSNTLINISDTLQDLQDKEMLGVKVIMAQEEERQRVARDIHDGLAQSLSNIVLRCEICEKLFTMDITRAGNEIKEIKQLVRDSLKEIRRIIFDLRPMSLDDLGLVHTLQQYVDNYSRESEIKVIVDCYDEEQHIDSVIEVAVFRIIQEALNNIQKYSQATRAIIKLVIQDNMLVGTIVDNGTGFDVPSVLKMRPQNAYEGGFGIIGMKQRAQLLKGKLDIESQPNKGTIITFEIPLLPIKKQEKEDTNEEDNSNDSR
ncbi:sensor histidine kinase [Xylanivirga thermophila]|uniref:sensor histidine kinase n=1 Tax=Xylanivirga thermophila TaxID=2496273 RepID=UPI00101B918C|nr:sensor histidine kinase [Xylanivirga thermophila]